MNKYPFPCGWKRLSEIPTPLYYQLSTFFYLQRHANAKQTYIIHKTIIDTNIKKKFNTFSCAREQQRERLAYLQSLKRQLRVGLPVDK